MKHSWSSRLVARVLVVGQVVWALPVGAHPVKASASERGAAPRAESPQVVVNRTPPRTAEPPKGPVFSAVPTVSEISRVPVFEEPLLPLAGRPTTAEENKALAGALSAYAARVSNEDFGRFEAFLGAHPHSPWRASLLTNLGSAYRKTGYFTKALAALEEAWSLSKGEETSTGRVVADKALGELAELRARLGHVRELEELFDEIRGRDVRGSATEKLAGARQGLWTMRNRPEMGFRCGPLALDRILASRPGYVTDPRIVDYRSTQRGTSLAEVTRLANTVGMNMRMAQRHPGATIVTPAVIHWKAGHFTALIKEVNGRYLTEDPTFGGGLWVSKAVFDAEGDGYAIIPEGPLPEGWSTVSEGEGGMVWGKGATPSSDPQEQNPCQSNQSGGDGSCTCSCSSGLTTYNVYSLLVSLHLQDTPVGYTPAIGPSVRFTLNYSQREVFQPATFTYGNVGPKWSYDWQSYIEDDPNQTAADVKVYLRGGGQETATGFASGSVSTPVFKSRATIERKSTSPIRYERQRPDGSKDIYSYPWGSSPRKVFLTQSVDPRGNALTLSYELSPQGQPRLHQITDALGQATTLSYGLANDPLKITRVTDPFGRYAALSYNPSGQLSSITDVIGLTSSFVYGSGDFIQALTTPYGTTRFATGDNGAPGAGRIRWVEITDPLGGVERVEYDDGPNSTVPFSDPVAPAGFNNSYLYYRNTFVWSKRAMALYPGNYTKARIVHWLHSQDLTTAMGVIESEKMPLERRVWYAYPGQPSTIQAGTSTSPSKVARVLDDGTTQSSQNEYNQVGKVCKTVDPLSPVGRETRYTYYNKDGAEDIPCTNGFGIDLLRVEQKNGTSSDLLQTYTYNAQHLPLTSTDASGQTTTFTYDAQGRVLTVVTPARKGPDGVTDLTDPERTTTYAYYPNTPGTTGAGRLQSVTGPSSPQGSPLTTYVYDGYGRPRTVSEAAGSLTYSVTTDYDLFDRPTKVTYPDLTYEQTVWDKLDARSRRDRLGRWTQTDHDALRHPVMTRDPAGRVTTQAWCACGTLDQLTDPNGNATTWERDIQSRVKKEIRADGTFTAFTYENTTSRLKTRTDAKGQVATYTYAVDDRLTRTECTNAQIATPNVLLAYDPIYNRLASMTDGIGTTTYHYTNVAVPPALGAMGLSSIDAPVPGGGSTTVSYTYDELGRIATRGLTSPSSFQSTMRYDAIGRLARIESPVGSFVWAYRDQTGRPGTVTYPNSQRTTYDYLDTLGDLRLYQITHQPPSGPNLSQFRYTYDAVGNIRTWLQVLGANPAKLYEYGYDAADQLVSAAQKDPLAQPPTLQKNYAYAYDAAGNRTINAEDSVATTAQYNSRNELTQQTGGGALPVAGFITEAGTVTVNDAPASVDRLSNFAGAAPVGTGTQTVTVKATDLNGNLRTSTYSVTVSGTSQTYSYDPNGNLTGDGTKTYQWDAENRLVAVLQGSTTLASFTYDGKGRRATKTAGAVTHSYMLDGSNIIEERFSSGQTMDFVQGAATDRPLAQRDQAGAVSYFLTDHLGSIAQMANSTGVVTLIREYDPWGNLLQGPTTAGYAFTGREWDPDAGFYYYRARYYDPRVGRFLSEDPIGLVGGSNFYAYAGSSPIAYSDPTGLTSCFVRKQHEFARKTTDPDTGKSACGCTLKGDCRDLELVFSEDGIPMPKIVRGQVTVLIEFPLGTPCPDYCKASSLKSLPELMADKKSLDWHFCWWGLRTSPPN